jgi:sulfatase maturation enzyme AslB (radical SAM superfamily)
MLMLTRSCELRCGYCLVQKEEDAQSLSVEDARRGIDLLMRSDRPCLELQFFGGEPTRAWSVLHDAIVYTANHPSRRGRSLEILVTTNGVGMTAERVAFLADYPVMILFSLDGDAGTHKRFRAAHLLSDAAAYENIDRCLTLLMGSDLAWFMNAVLPPADADGCMARYRWARSQGVPRFQLNYAVGMRWSQDAMDRYVEGLLEVLRHHHDDDGGMKLFNWRSDCEPVMLSDDLIVDVDGTVYHDGAIFLERRFPALKQTYLRGHLDDLNAFDPLRWPLAKLYDVMVETYPEGSDERGIVLDNCRFGAQVDLAILALARELGRS